MKTIYTFIICFITIVTANINTKLFAVEYPSVGLIELAWDGNGLNEFTVWESTNNGARWKWVLNTTNTSCVVSNRLNKKPIIYGVTGWKWLNGIRLETEMVTVPWPPSGTNELVTSKVVATLKGVEVVPDKWIKISSDLKNYDDWIKISTIQNSTNFLIYHKASPNKPYLFYEYYFPVGLTNLPPMPGGSVQQIIDKK